MTISNRAKLIIAGVLVLIAIILILLFLPRPGQKPAPTPTASNTEQPTPTPTPTPTAPTPVVTPEQQAEASATTVAKIFVERYGSYSSESEAANLEDVLSLTTPSYRQKLEAQIASLQARPPAAEYYGVSTRVVSTQADTVSATSATFNIMTQREETKGSLSNTSVAYQMIVVDLVLSGTDWLVDNAEWL